MSAKVRDICRDMFRHGFTIEQISGTVRLPIRDVARVIG